MKRSVMLSALCICVILGFGMTTSVFAAPLDKKAKIVQLIQSMNMDAIVDSMGPAFSQMITQDLKSRGVEVTPGKSEKLAKAIFKVMKNNMNSYMGGIVALYDSAYSENEIDDLLAFYKTPTGQKTLAITPKLMEKSQLMGMKWGQTLAPQIQKEVEAVFAAE